MKGVILNNKIRSGFFTNMKDIFDAINNQQIKYNWLISGHECNCYPSEEISPEQTSIWISGQALTELVSTYKIQFIWGVFSGFRKSLDYNELITDDLPYADENRNIWSSKLKTQHPKADIEIVCFDSSLVIIISKIDSIIEDFMNNYAEAIDFIDYIS